MASKGKAHQLEILAAILPASAEVADMLRFWREADAAYWGSKLTPCWLTANIEKYGKALGTWAPATRTLNLVPMLWPGRYIDGIKGSLDLVRDVVVHETCHQAQGSFYRHLDAAKGPRGKWFDSSHRCPSWSRAVEDVIRVERMDVFCPVWHRSTGNVWHPWVPASEDWMVWEKADPAATFDGRRLLSFRDSKCFGPGKGLAATDENGDPIELDL